MFLDCLTTVEVMKISNLQQELFDPDRFDRDLDPNIDRIAGDWNRDVNGDFFPLNKLIKGAPRNPDSPGSEFGGHRVFGDAPQMPPKTMPPKIEFGQGGFIQEKENGRC
jgi:hypothetical protein